MLSCRMNLSLRLVAALMFLCSGALRAQETWTASASPTTQNLWSICYGKGQFVAVGEGGTILTSPDGTAWTKRASGSTLWLVGVGYGNNLFVVVGDQGAILTSPDGIAWTTIRTGGTRINAVAYGNGIFYAVDESGNSWSSTDGVSWSFYVPARPEGVQLRGLVYVTPIFVATGASGTIQTTFDGVPVTGGPPVFGVPNITSNFLESVAYGRGLFVATGASGATLTSRDAVNWATQPNAPAYFRGIAFCNNQFVGVGVNGSIATSFDGNGWTSRSTGTAQVLTAVAASDNAAIAVGFGGAILRSSAARNAPAIVTQPASFTEVAGNNVLLTAAAAGSPPLTYQWTFNGTPITGATSDTLFLSLITTANAGNYTFSASNSSGFATSAAAVLTVIASAATRANLIDPAFLVSPAPDIPPGVIVEQPDGKLIFGGSFTFLNGSLAQKGIARLQRDGLFDTTFAVGSGVSGGGVTAIALQGDGRILISGSFTSVNGTSRPGLARLNSDGSLDTSFAPSPAALPAGSSIVGAQPDGRIIVLTNSGTYRLRTDGTVDSGNPVASYATGILATLAPDGKIVIATSSQVLRLNADGAADSTFTAYSPNLGGSPPRAVRVLADGKIGVVTNLATIRGPVWAASRVNGDGSLDSSFSAQGPGGAIGISVGTANAAFTSDGRLYVSQNVTSLVPAAVTNSLKRYVRDGINVPDPSFVFPDVAGDSADFVLPLSSGQSIAVGSFTGTDGVRRPGVVRLQASNATAPVPPAVASVVPATLTVNAGDPISIRVTFAGTGPFTAGVNSATLTAVNGNFLDLGTIDAQQNTSYSLTLSNAGGSVTKTIFVRVLPSAPSLTLQPQDTTVYSAYAAGGTTTFSVSARGTEPLAYQWFFNGAPITGANTARLTVTVTTATTGIYSVVVSNSVGQTASGSARLAFDPTSRIVNLASRGFAGTGENALIVGFAISGATPKQFLVRAAGPALTKFGITGALADPQLTIYDASGKSVAQNDDWGTAFPSGPSAFDSVGAFRFDTGSRDSALLIALAPGLYSAVVSGKNNATGVALAEIYDADTTAPRLVNLSSRLLVGTGEQVAIPGIVVSGGTPKKLLIRGIGPTLSLFGVQNPLVDPVLTVIGSGGAAIATNDNWGTAANAADIAATSASVGAFALPTSSKDAALLVTLQPGAYTALVSGANGSSGVALVEVYEVP